MPNSHGSHGQRLFGSTSDKNTHLLGGKVLRNRLKSPFFTIQFKKYPFDFFIHVPLMLWPPKLGTQSNQHGLELKICQILRQTFLRMKVLSEWVWGVCANSWTAWISDTGCTQGLVYKGCTLLEFSLPTFLSFYGLANLWVALLVLLNHVLVVEDFSGVILQFVHCYETLERGYASVH